MAELNKKGLINRNALTVTGKTVKDNLKNVKVRDHTVIRKFDNPYHPQGGIAILRGNLAPDGAVVKQSAVAPEMMRNKGKARVFNAEEEAVKAILGEKLNQVMWS